MDEKYMNEIRRQHSRRHESGANHLVCAMIKYMTIMSSILYYIELLTGDQNRAYLRERIEGIREEINTMEREFWEYLICFGDFGRRGDAHLTDDE